MTTITFKEKLKISRLNFKDIFDFKNYLDKNFYFTKLMELDEDEITKDVKKNIKKTKKIKKEDLCNI